MESKKKTEEVCDEHKTDLNYFCKTCQVSICSDCAMFGTQHKDHEFERLTDVYNTHMDQLKNEKSSLTQRLTEMNTQMNSIENTIEKVTKAKEEKVKEIDSYVENA